MIEALSLGLSIVAVVTSVWSAVIVYQQTRILRQTNMLPILIDMFKEFRSVEFKLHLSYIYNQLKKECKPEETGFRNLPETAAIHVLPVSHFFDNLGLLVATNVVDENLVLSFTAGSIESTWTVLESYIQQERDFRGAPYQQFFEHLVERARVNPLSGIIKKMKLQTLPMLPK